MEKIMKKMMIFGITLVMLLCVLAGCKEEETGEPELGGNIIIELPADVYTINVPLGTLLTAVYSGNETVSYQWNRNGAAVTGKTTANKFEPAATGQYTVTVSATGYKSKTSAAVKIIPSHNMVFVDNLDNTGREFIIYDDLTFRVEISEPFFDQFDEEFREGLYEIQFIPGIIVSGKVTDTQDTWLSDTITGTAIDLTCENHPPLAIIFDLIPIVVGIELSYTKDGSGEITAINVTFIPDDEEDGFAAISELLMGGTYIRKE